MFKFQIKLIHEEKYEKILQTLFRICSKMNQNMFKSHQRFPMIKPKVITPTTAKNQRSSLGRRPISSLQSPQKKQVNIVVKKFENDPMKDSLTKTFLENPDFSETDTESLQSYLDYLKDYTHFKGMNAEYDEAEQCQELQKLIQIEISKRILNDDKKENNEPSNSEIQESFEKDWQKKFADFDFETAEKLKELGQKQEEEREKFDEQWRGENTRKYRKPSAKLLQMKQIEKTLASSGEYRNAKQVHKDVEAIQRQEFTEAQNQLIVDYQIAQKKLQIKFKREEEQLISNRQHEKVLLESKKQQEQENINKRQTVLMNRPTQKKKNRQRPFTTSPSLGQQKVVIAKNFLNEEDFLLPPIIPPNDPKLQEELRKKREQENKKRSNYQKQNAQSALAKFSLIPNISASSFKSSSSTEQMLNPNSSEEKLATDKENTKDVYVTGKLDQEELEVKYVDKPSQIE